MILEDSLQNLVPNMACEIPKLVYYFTSILEQGESNICDSPCYVTEE